MRAKNKHSFQSIILQAPSALTALVWVRVSHHVLRKQFAYSTITQCTDTTSSDVRTSRWRELRIVAAWV